MEGKVVGLLWERCEAVLGPPSRDSTGQFNGPTQAEEVDPQETSAYKRAQSLQAGKLQTMVSLREWTGEGVYKEDGGVVRGRENGRMRARQEPELGVER